MPDYKFSIFNLQFSIKKGYKMHGFTLVELLVAVSIIAVLMGVGFSSFQNAQERGRDGKRKGDLKAVQQALEVYFQTNGKYPASNSGDIECNSTGDSTVKTWGLVFSCSGLTYMQQLPQDSAYQSTSGYFYQSVTPTSYVLSASLENSNDPDLSGLPCTPQSGRNYCVINP